MANSIQVLSLNFQILVLERATGPALRLQAAEQVGQIVCHGRQAADDGYDLTLFSLFDREMGFLPCRRQSWRGSGRAGAVSLERAAALAFRRLVKRGPGE